MSTTGLWLSAAAAAKILGIHVSGVNRVCRLGGVRVQQLPSYPPRYSAEDVRTLAARSVTRETVPA
jgi:predicted site-specific integrase-resolvase